MKRTYEKDLQGQYLLDSMETLTMNGDAYVSGDQLYRFSKRNHKALTYDQFRADRAFCSKRGSCAWKGVDFTEKTSGNMKTLLPKRWRKSWPTTT